MINEWDMNNDPIHQIIEKLRYYCETNYKNAQNFDSTIQMLIANFEVMQHRLAELEEKMEMLEPFLNQGKKMRIINEMTEDNIPKSPFEPAKLDPNIKVVINDND